MAPLLPPISQQMALPSLAHTYFKQRQHNTRASLPQGDRPVGLGAAQTSIFLGERPPPKNTYGGWPFQSPPRPKIHTAGCHPSLSHTPIPHRGSRGAIAHTLRRANTDPNLWLASPPIPTRRNLPISYLGLASNPSPTQGHLPIPYLGPTPIPNLRLF